MPLTMTEHALADLSAALEAANAGRWDGLRCELQAGGAEAAFWFRVRGPAPIAEIAALFGALAAEMRAAYDGAAFSAGFVTALPEGVILWDALDDAELFAPAPTRPWGLRPERYALTEFGPGAEVFPVEIPAAPPAMPAPA